MRVWTGVAAWFRTAAATVMLPVAGSMAKAPPVLPPVIVNFPALSPALTSEVVTVPTTCPGNASSGMSKVAGIIFGA